MYHCHIHFYLVGCRCSAFEEIKKMPPLERFTHEFMESDVPAETLTADADVILAYLNGEDVRKLFGLLCQAKRRVPSLF